MGWLGDHSEAAAWGVSLMLLVVGFLLLVPGNRNPLVGEGFAAHIACL